MGPIYCETPSLLSRFPLEPVNTWSNLFIIALGIVAIVLVARRPTKIGSKGLWALALLLTLTGLGSFMWHGWRTSAFLVLDALPGALFLFTAVYLWLRTFYNGWPTFFIFCGFLVLEVCSTLVGDMFFRGQALFVSIAPPVVLLGAWLVARTYQESRRAAALGGGALLLAVAAVIFRTIDIKVCASLAIGTHFLWHIFLSLAALLIILMFIIIDYTRRFASAPAPRPPRAPLHM